MKENKIRFVTWEKPSRASQNLDTFSLIVDKYFKVQTTICREVLEHLGSQLSVIVILWGNIFS